MNIIAATLLILAAGALAGAITGAIFLYSSERGMSARLVDLDHLPIVAPRLPVLIYPREESDYIRHRIDRHPAYVWMLIGLWLFSWTSVFVPYPDTGFMTNLSSVSDTTKASLATCLLVGSGLSLVGSVLGKGHLKLYRSISKNIVSDFLGDDIRMPYVLGWAGQASIMVSMWFYAVSVAIDSPRRLFGTLGGMMSLVVGCVCTTMIIWFIIRIHRYVTAREQIIQRAIDKLDNQDPG